VRECRVKPVNLAVTKLVWFYFFPHETAGASSTRHSPRPHLFLGEKFLHHSGVNAPRERGGVSWIRHSGAMQSIEPGIWSRHRFAEGGIRNSKFHSPRSSQGEGTKGWCAARIWKSLIRHSNDDGLGSPRCSLTAERIRMIVASLSWPSCRGSDWRLSLGLPREDGR
jgi:hypothetical protein